MRNETLDGVRGVAVLLVLLYHHGLLNSGWIGVDLFFVLSGYLITGIIRRHTGPDFWRGFWVKRATRILPPFLLVLLATAALGFALPLPLAMLYLLSLGDVLAYLHPNFEVLRPLWSLAVEEHFYLLWPLAVRSLSRHRLILLLTGLLVVEPVLRLCISLVTHDWQVVYFLTPFRLDGLCLGSLLAILFERATIKTQITRWSATAGALLAGCWITLRLTLGIRFTRDDPTVYYNVYNYALISCLAAASIAYLLTHPRSWFARILAVRWLSWTGLISYGLYLYQMPVHLLVSRYLTLSPVRALLVDAPLTFALAAASYTWMEVPMMRWGKRLAGHAPVPPRGAAGVVPEGLSAG